MMVQRQCILVLVSALLLHHSSAQTVTMSTILADLFQDYDKKLPPKYNNTAGDRQVVINLNIYVASMFSVSEADMDYKMSIFLRARWTDERLKYTDTLNLTRLELDTSIQDTVWVPDIYILNEKYSDFHEVTVPNKMVHLYPDGQVQLSMRVTGAFSCLMNLRKYPFDKQACTFEVESYGHSTESMRFVWTSTAVTMADNIQFPQFQLAKTTSYFCEKDYFGIVFPCVGLKFVLERNYAYYIIQIYLPSILIVVLSWVNFWLDCGAVPARISLGLLTVLTMTTQSAGARADLPRVSYVKAIDVYMATCLTFVFLGLVEFAWVNVLTRNETKPSKKKAKCDDNTTNTETTSVASSITGSTASLPHKNMYQVNTDNNLLDVGEVIKPRDGGDQLKVHVGQTERDRSQVKSQTRLAAFKNCLNNCSLLPCFTGRTGLNKARMVDKASRLIFPITFSLFNLIYWVFYFTWMPEHEVSLYD